MIVNTVSIVIIVFSLVSLSSCQDMILSNFIDDVICDVTNRISKRCSIEVTAGRSLIRCVAKCGRDASCIGASLDKETGKCFLHRPCRDVGVCIAEDSSHRYMSKKCVNGTLDILSRSCVCTNGFHGDRCEKYPQSCRFLITDGRESDRYLVYIDPFQDGRNPILVLCYIFPPLDYYSIIILKNNGQRILSNRTWEEYSNGFHVDDSYMWAGLDILHILTNAGCHDFYFKLDFIPNPDQRKITRQYRQFVLSNANMKYQFTFVDSVSTITGIVPIGAYFGDCLFSLQNTPFSTWDNDNDGYDGDNCASKAGSGWWYPGCNNPCNAFGLGFNYWATKPRDQLFSLIGVNMPLVISEVEDFTMYLRCL